MQSGTISPKKKRWSQPKMKTKLVIVTSNNDMYVKASMSFFDFLLFIGDLCLSGMDLRVPIKRHMFK